MKVANQDLRTVAKAAKVPLWMIAEELGISEPTMTRRLRRELDSEEQVKIINIVAEIAKRKEAEDYENAGD